MLLSESKAIAVEEAKAKAIAVEEAKAKAIALEECLCLPNAKSVRIPPEYQVMHSYAIRGKSNL